ncbi:uncharacterized protein DNG_02336 [Cephalotrichum gorgonifer]|uniref:Zn(2)-C6 fungal-type domain-containing protein n=1 Tax=Cephalotrichum gorgonifer TaxID=2041049 RepID=A0AAE8SSK4_9PEZI|nr:uncharacterized protein DNG_02336 [Cephalotrichum gorgonifer]
MFKSCDYCRHRKKKCKVPPDSTRCSDCEHLDLACEFSARHPSLKRRETSRKNAARIGIPVSKDSESSRLVGGSGGSVVDEANLMEGDCQLRLAGRRDMANKRLFSPRDSGGGSQGAPLSTNERYWRDVHPFWPFVSEEMLEGELGRDANFKHCIDSACLLSLNLMGKFNDTPLKMERLTSTLQQGRLSMSDIAIALLSCPFVDLDDGLVQTIFDTVDYGVANAVAPTPPAIVAGALITNVWRRLAGHSHHPLHLSTDVLRRYGKGLDSKTFGYHYLHLSQHAAEFDRLRISMKAQGIQPDTPLVWSRLEYECLLWQVCLPPSLLDTRDDLPATPESVVIHCLSSLLLLSFYGYVLEHADTLGALIALQPVPGVLLFLCTLARSTFICPRELLDRMPLLVNIQAQTARIMLTLWHRTGFENCRGILNLWRNPGGRFPELERDVRGQIGSGPWAIEEIDGYSVFWTFRDLRTLTTKFIFGDRPSFSPLSG